MVRYSVMVRLRDDLKIVYITSILTESSYISKKVIIFPFYILMKCHQII